MARRVVYWNAPHIMARLKRVEGQLRGIEAMIVREDSCRDILTQVAAAQGALAQVEHIITACNIVEVVADTMEISGDVSILQTNLRELLG
ncbi:MAG: metal-sensitive transcriptional regulator [Thermaerobacter sp.]|nr:metal-sensitive transcriptional regulator [Thermaerobacter sp.]